MECDLLLGEFDNDDSGGEGPSQEESRNKEASDRDWAEPPRKREQFSHTMNIFDMYGDTSDCLSYHFSLVFRQQKVCCGSSRGTD